MHQPVRDTVIYTAIYGNRDRLFEVPNSDWLQNADYVCFTDNPFLRSKTWQIVLCCPKEKPLHPRRTSRWFKIMQHLFLPQYARSVWIDARCWPAGDLSLQFESFDAQIALTPHFRHCVYRELRFQKVSGKYDHAIRVSSLKNKCVEHGIERGWLHRGMPVFRRHSQRMVEFNETWWKWFGNMQRDQMALAIALQLTKIPKFCYRRRHIRNLTVEVRHLKQDVRENLNYRVQGYYDSL